MKIMQMIFFYFLFGQIKKVCYNSSMLNKYERVYNWLINELEITKQNHPSEDVRTWLAMLQESVEYNLSKFDS